jgi:hypothetical protein
VVVVSRRGLDLRGDFGAPLGPADLPARIRALASELPIETLARPIPTADLRRLVASRPTLAPDTEVVVEALVERLMGALAVQPPPVVHVHVPEQPAPIVEVHVPEQPAPVVNVDVPEPEPRRIKFERDNQGRIVSAEEQ